MGNRCDSLEWENLVRKNLFPPDLNWAKNVIFRSRHDAKTAEVVSKSPLRPNLFLALGVGSGDSMLKIPMYSFA